MGALPFSVRKTVNFVLLKEQAEEIRRYLLEARETGGLDDTYTIHRVLSIINDELGKVEDTNDNPQSERVEGGD
jgi:hypothetical protein